MKRFAATGSALAVLACFLSGCFLLPFLSDLFGLGDDGPIAPGVTGPLGSPMPSLSPAQLQTFERGIAAMQKRFDFAEGLGAGDQRRVLRRLP